MTQLIDFRETVRSFYQKYEGIIRPAGKFVFSLLILFLLSRMFGYNPRINRFYIFLIVSALQAFLPISFLYYMSAILVAANLWVISPEIMTVCLAVLLICWLLFVRVDRRYAVIVVLTPVLFFLKLEYLMPVLSGMILGIGGIMPFVCGIIVYFISTYAESVSAALAATTGNETGVGLQRLYHLISVDHTLLVVIVAFAVIMFISAVLYHVFHESAWLFTVILGNIALALLLLSGKLIFDLEYAVFRVFLECILAVGLGFVYQFFKGIGDVSRIEKVSFEDDEYIYYVKAVPKMKVSMTDRNITQITPEETEDFDLPDESFQDGRSPDPDYDIEMDAGEGSD
ncbi:MAG: hypothetical protein IJ137_02520 [Eubacterium sp.]|nr:hypothetical protein [Eubacterium sp.]